MNIYDIWDNPPNAVRATPELLEEFNLALRFANPFETKLPEKIAFSDPVEFTKSHKDSGHAAPFTPTMWGAVKPGVLGNILRAFMDQKISLMEFGGLIRKLAPTAHVWEWTLFLKPLLEQRLLYNPLYRSEWTFPHWKIAVPQLRTPTYTRTTLPKDLYVMPRSDSVWGTYLFRIGKNKMIPYVDGRCIDLPEAEGMHENYLALRNGDVEYGVLIEAKRWYQSINLQLGLVKDFFLWEDFIKGDLRLPYGKRLQYIEMFLNDDPDGCLPEVIRTTPERFDQDVRVLFEQNSPGIEIRDATSTLALNGDQWSFFRMDYGDIIEVHGDDQNGMSHVIVKNEFGNIHVAQGSAALTSQVRKEIYSRRQELIGKPIQIRFDDYVNGVPNYSLWLIDVEEYL